MQKKPNAAKKYRVVSEKNGCLIIGVRGSSGYYETATIASKKNLSQIGNTYFHTIKGRSVLIGYSSTKLPLKHSATDDGLTRIDFAPNGMKLIRAGFSGI